MAAPDPEAERVRLQNELKDTLEEYKKLKDMLMCCQRAQQGESNFDDWVRKNSEEAMHALAVEFDHQVTYENISLYVGTERMEALIAHAQEHVDKVESIVSEMITNPDALTEGNFNKLQKATERGMNDFARD